MVRRERSSYLETSKFLLNVVLQLAESSAVTGVQGAQLTLEESLIENLTNTDTATGGLVTVAGTDTLAGSTDLATAQLGLFQAIHDGVKVEANVSTVGDEDALSSALQTLVLQRSQLLEETRDVHHGTGANQVDTGRGDETGGKDVEVVGLVTMNNGVTGIYPFH